MLYHRATPARSLRPRREAVFILPTLDGAEDPAPDSTKNEVRANLRSNSSPSGATVSYTIADATRMRRTRNEGVKRSIRGWLWLASCLPAMLGAYWSVSPGPEAADPRLTPDGRLDFNRDIRPILARSCWPCHKEGQPQLEATGNLRLDTFEGATGDRGGYQAMSPGKPEESAIWLRINPELPQLRMPPPVSLSNPSATGKGVNSALDRIRRPIRTTLGVHSSEATAAPQGHRRLVGPKRHRPVRPIPDREAGIPAGTRSRQGDLAPKSLVDADRPPPTVEELDAFLADVRPDAYDRAVDRLLAVLYTESIRPGIGSTPFAMRTLTASISTTSARFFLIAIG